MDSREKEQFTLWLEQALQNDKDMLQLAFATPTPREVARPLVSFSCTPAPWNNDIAESEEELQDDDENLGAPTDTPASCSGEPRPKSMRIESKEPAIRTPAKSAPTATAAKPKAATKSKAANKRGTHSTGTLEASYASSNVEIKKFVKRKST